LRNLFVIYPITKGGLFGVNHDGDFPETVNVRLPRRIFSIP